MADCSSLPQLEYGQFSDWLHQKVGSQRIPIAGSLEVTERCNLRCRHCYIPTVQRAGSRRRELKLPEIERILVEITEAGCLWLLLTGGEPFLRRDFLDIYAAARRKGLILTLFTNGTLITRPIADYLAEWRPFKIEITLYGATQETYERITAVPGSYARCMTGIQLLVERNLPLGLKTMLMTLNRHELDRMQALADNLGAEFRFDPILNAALDGSNRPAGLRLTPEEVVAVEKTDPGRSRSWPERYRQTAGMEISGRPLYLCGAGKNSFHIDAAGRLSQCLTARNPSYNLREGNFSEGWEQFLPDLVTRQYSEAFPCRACALRMVCPQCPAIGATEMGNPEKPVDYLCRVANLRREAFAPG
jgi:radical SAM protein with 4Fe4S-binding SPASM domain